MEVGVLAVASGTAGVLLASLLTRLILAFSPATQLLQALSRARLVRSYASGIFENPRGLLG